MKKEMLINCAQSEECRIAIVEDGLLEELYVERASQESYVGNIYKGKIVNIEPSIQAAFVDFGIGRNGFLHVSDVDPVYYKHLLPKHVLDEIEAEQEAEYGFNGGRRRDRGDRGGDLNGDRGERRPRDRGPREAAPAPALTSWLPSEPAGDDGGFGMGLDDAPARIEAIASEEFGVLREQSPVTPPPLPWEKKPEVAPPMAKAPTRAPRVEPELLEDDGFGAGLEFEEPAAAAEETLAVSDDASGEKPKRKRVVKTDKAEKEKKPVRRRKKAEDDSDEPTPPKLESAEHRTEEGDQAAGGNGVEDDGEIKPFFDEPFGGFDVDAPNDRFTGSNDSVDDDAFGGFEESPKSEVVADAEAVEPDDAAEVEENFDPPERLLSDFDKPRRGRGERGERGDRGDRGPRRERGDRGPRMDRGDRGPRGGGDRFRPSGPPPRDKGIPRLPIEQIFKRGQEVIVQVIKEGIGTKGPTLSTYVSIAGRYLVLMPSLGRVGVSRKIEDAEGRRRLRDIMNDLNPPKGVGFIVRTAAIDREPAELQTDLAYLLRLWQVIVRRIRKVSAPVEIYRESDMITRTIRDNFKADIDSITVDDPVAFQHASEFLQVVMPKYADRIRLHDHPEPLFHRHRIEEEIAKLNQKRLDLPKGGSIIIEQTEALVAIDVNSGTFRAENDAEQNAFMMNVMAAKEIARQLRLRDLGGVIVNDFIDMRDERHRRIVEKTLRDALERDKARTKILRISQFGIIEMTRQRMQQSLKKRIYNDCPHCKGSGHVKTDETLGIDAMRLLHLAAHKAMLGMPPIAQVQVSVCTDAANHLLNRKRRDIAALESQAKIEVTVIGVPHVSPDHLEVKCHDQNGTEVKLFSPAPPPKQHGKRR